MNNELPTSISIENINEVKEVILTEINSSKKIELNFSSVEKIDIAGIQLIISSLLLCDRKKKEIDNVSFSSIITESLKKNGFDNEKTIMKHLKEE